MCKQVIKGLKRKDSVRKADKVVKQGRPLSRSRSGCSGQRGFLEYLRTQCSHRWSFKGVCDDHPTHIARLQLPRMAI